MSKQKEILIDLKEARDAQVLKKEGIIQQEALRKLKNLIKTIFERSRAFIIGLDDKYITQRYHDVITIDGDRGTGKSTFILNAFELIRKGELFEESDELKFDARIKPLGIIDPTMIEGMENIFITIISKIKAVVDERIDEKEEENIDRWNKKLNELARGLSSIEGIGTDALKNELWDNHEYILQEGLINATHGGKLENDFHKFVCESLKVIGKDAFIIAFDDIDTAFKSGWPVLEIIRKYLTTPQLIVVLSGDLELYSKLVRKAQWKNLGVYLLKYDNRPELKRLVNKLEDQYLLKVLKPDYRIKLDNLRFYNENYIVKIKHPEGQESAILLNDVFKSICESMFFLKSASEIRRYIDYFLSLPVRTIIHILVSFSYTCNDKWKLEIIENFNISMFHDSLASIFQRALLSRAYSFDAIKAISNLSGINKLAVDINFSDDLENMHRLKPEDMDDTDNPLRIVMGAHYARYMKTQPASYFDYMVKVGLSKEIAQQKYNVEMENYIRFVRLDMDDRAIQVARKFTAFFRGKAYHWDIRSILLGTVRLYSDYIDQQHRDELLKIHYRVRRKEHIGSVNYPVISHLKPFYDVIQLAQNEGTEPDFNKYCNTLEILEQEIISWHRLFVNIPFSVNVSRTGDSTPYMSIFNLLGFISVLLETENRGEFERELAEYAQLRLYHEYGSGEQVEPKRYKLRVMEKETEYSGVEKRHGYLAKEFLDIIWEWKESAKNLPYIPVHVVARIRARFFNSLTQMDSNISDNDIYAGYLLHQFIVVFLNAILVESSLYDADIDRISLRNPTTDDSIFIRNINWWREQNQNQFFSFFFSCPIWGLFLRPDDGEYSVFHHYVEHISEYLDNDKNFFKSLLGIRYNKETKYLKYGPDYPHGKIWKFRCAVLPRIKVFINYAKEDEEIAKKIYKDLKDAGVIPWMESEDFIQGRNMKLMIREAIKESSYFLALLSSNSISKRGFFQKEVKIALDILDEYPSDEIFIIPARIDECTPADVRLQELETIDLFPSYEKAFKKILDTLAIDYIELGEDFFLKFANLYYPLNSVLIQRREGEIEFTKPEIMIFISYAPEDREDAEKIYNYLKQAGITVWLDTQSLLPGQKREEEVRKAINNSTFFIALLSFNYVEKTGYFKQELDIAYMTQANIPSGSAYIIPVRLDDCNIPKLLGSIACVDLFPSFEKSMVEFLRAIEFHSGRLQEIDKNSYPPKADIKKIDYSTRDNLLDTYRHLTDLLGTIRYNIKNNDAPTAINQLDNDEFSKGINVIKELYQLSQIEPPLALRHLKEIFLLQEVIEIKEANIEEAISDLKKIGRLLDEYNLSTDLNLILELEQVAILKAFENQNIAIDDENSIHNFAYEHIAQNLVVDKFNLQSRVKKDKGTHQKITNIFLQFLKSHYYTEKTEQ